MQKYGSDLKFVWQEFDAKPRYDFRKMLQNATLEVIMFIMFAELSNTFDGSHDQQSAWHSYLASIWEASHENLGSWLVSSTSVKYKKFQSSVRLYHEFTLS